MLPNFFIIGAPNSGTTSLWYLLKQHPEVFMSEIKEPRFFSREDYVSEWDNYQSLFQHVRDEKAIGEASVNYSETHIWPDIPKRIKSVIPNAKIIYIIRNPMDRLESCFRQALKSGHWQKKYYTEYKMSLNFNLAVKEYPHMYGSTRYWYHLNNYRRKFDDSNILLLFFEDFVQKPEQTLNKCFTFLNVSSDVHLEEVTIKKNPGAEKKMVRPIYWFLHEKKLFEQFARIIPTSIKNRVKRNALYRPIPKKIVWKKETKLWLEENLKNEIDPILSFAEKPKDFWIID